MQQAKLAGPHVPGVRAKESCFLHACFCTKLIPYQPQGGRAKAQTDGRGSGNRVPLVHLAASWACSPSRRQPGEDFQGDSVGTRSQATQLGKAQPCCPSARVWPPQNCSRVKQHLREERMRDGPKGTSATEGGCG